MKPTPPSGDLLRLERADVLATLLFCDLTGYSQAAARLSVVQLIEGLNAYQTLVVDALKENKGTVASFIGDAIFAYWLAGEHSDHAELACRFVASLRERLAAVPPVAPPGTTLRIGIHTGSVALVSIGRGDHRDLTLMGDAVNLAARLNSLCATYQAQAIITGEVLAHAPGVQGAQLLEAVTLKGRTTPTTLYRI